MTDTRQHHKPTPKQMRLLRQLAMERGESFAMPQTSTQASAEIRRLTGRKRSTRSDVARERAEVSRDMATRRGGSAAVRDDELTGYGSTARWSTDPGSC